VPCKKLILETCRFEQNYYDQNENLKFIGWNDKYPNDGTAFIEKYENAVPKDVLDDFEEGAKSIKNGCLKAGVSMFRRSLQSALINLGADESLELVDQIKNQSGLTQDIKDWAHNIRILGNWGAHPQTDNLKDIDLKLAEETQSFLEQFFNYVYLMPSMVANARQRNKKQETEKLKEEES
jgi:hypothetical protein